MFHRFIKTSIRYFCLFLLFFVLLNFEGSFIKKLVSYHNLSTINLPCDLHTQSQANSAHQKEHVFSCHSFQDLISIKSIKSILAFEPSLNATLPAFLKDLDIFIKDVFLDAPFQPPKIAL